MLTAQEEGAQVIAIRQIATPQTWPSLKRPYYSIQWHRYTIIAITGS